MKKKINNSLMGTATLAIIVTLLLTVAVCYHMLKNQIWDDLKVHAKTTGVILQMADDNAEGNLEEFSRQMQESHVRVTYIAADGTVVYDTVANASAMENHKTRPEVQEAFETGEGKQVRMSDTLEQNTYYYALLMENGMVLRISKDADSAYRMMEYAVPAILLMAVLLLATCIAFSRFLSESIIHPLKVIAQDSKRVEEMKVYEEMRPFIDAIKSKHDAVLSNARIRQEFTANVSHELKTPLTAISGYAELIENGMVSEEAEIQRFGREIHKSANRLLTLINDVIRLSELDDAKGEVFMERVCLWDSAQTCVDMLQINAAKHSVNLKLEGGEVAIMANKQMVEEVLYNLIDNAIRYNKENGTVTVSVRNRGDAAVLTVTDTGIGIPKEHQERIFERFYRVDKSRSKSTGGTGLGLAIVKHILIKLNAEISLESEAGKGTKIEVIFKEMIKDEYSETEVS